MNTPNIPHNRREPRLDGPESRVWVDPNSVLNDPKMSLEEKRALLASWASDARAVPNYPPLRQLENGALVTIDTILDALKRLDDLEGRANPEARREWPRKGHWSRFARGWRRYGRDDDDDDPFSPAPAMRPPLVPSLDDAAAAAA
ncbi:MAG TPA: hypothetical protein VG757_04900 [Devosia sp.]|jgi:hypothetical protein|nr:hypothetical protein [Devosia sp.]